MYLLKFLLTRLSKTHETVRSFFGLKTISSILKCCIMPTKKKLLIIIIIIIIIMIITGVLKNFGSFTRKHLFRSLFLIKLHRSCHQRFSINKGVLRNFATFPGEESPCARSQAYHFIKNRLWHRCFPVNFSTFLRTLFHRTP